MNFSNVEGLLAMTLLQWAVIIIAARLGGWLAIRLGQPPAVGEIAAGLALGPSLLGWLAPSTFAALFGESSELLKFLGKFGLVLFLFHVGLNFHVDHFRQRSRAVMAVAAAGVVAPFVLGLAIAPWLHANFAPETSLAGLAPFVGIAMSISALPIMARILMELGLERSVPGVTALSAAAIEDLVGWIGLAAIAAFVVARLDGWMTVGQVLGLLAFVLTLWKAVRPLHGWLIENYEVFSAPHWLFLIVALFLSCLCTWYLGVFAIFGAFAFGIAISGQGDLEARWEERYAMPVKLFLVPVFFTYTGLRTEIGGLDGLAWLGCGIVLALSVLGKFGGCYLAARGAGLGYRDAGAVGSLMNTRGLMGLIAVNIGLELGVLTGELFTMFVLMCFLTTVMCSPLLRFFLGSEAVRWHRVDGIDRTQRDP